YGREMPLGEVLRWVRGEGGRRSFQAPRRPLSARGLRGAAAEESRRLSGAHIGPRRRRPDAEIRRPGFAGCRRRRNRRERRGRGAPRRTVRSPLQSSFYAVTIVG